MARRIVPLAAIVLLCCAAPGITQPRQQNALLAQTSEESADATWPVSHAPVVRDSVGQPVGDVRLTSAAVNVDVRGPLAEVTFTITLKNTSDSVTGGELTFPLPDGATVSGYGLDVNGEMVDGVAVEKAEAQTIYQSEIERQTQRLIDPGLVEHFAGTTFRTMVWPIVPQGKRTAKVSYVMELSGSTDGNSASLVVPTYFGQNLDRFALSIFVDQATTPPQLSTGAFNGKRFKREKNGYRLKESATHARATDAHTIVIPQAPARSTIVDALASLSLEELASRTERSRPDVAFLIADTPAIPKLERTGLTNGKILVVWDASYDRQHANLERDLQVLQKVLARLNYPGVDLALLRDDLTLSGSFDAGQADTLRLVKTLQETTYDGATRLSAMKLPKNRAGFGSKSADRSNFRNSGKANAADATATAKDYDLALLFSDGIDRLGGGRPTSDIPVWAISSEASANHPGLHAICDPTGGRYLHLSDPKGDDAAIDAIGQPPLRILEIQADPSKVRDIYPHAGTVVDGRVTVVGRLVDDSATVTVVYGYGDQETSRATFELSPGTGAAGRLVERYWAQQKLNDLMLHNASRGELLELGKRYGIVTPVTSLLVLETIEQYRRHGVVPPKSRPQMYAAFQANPTPQPDRFDERLAREPSQRDTVERLWEGQRRWWELEVKVPENFRYAGTFSEEALATRSGNRAGDPQLAEADPQASPVAVDQGTADIADAGASGTDGLRAVHIPAMPPPGAATWGAAGSVLPIVVKPWNPQTPYLKAMRAVAPNDAYNAYLARRHEYARSPAFFLDCADLLFRLDRRTEGLRVLGSLLELDLGDPAIVRTVAARLIAMEEFDLAVNVCQKLVVEHPQTPGAYYQLAMALAGRADAGAARMRSGDALPEEKLQVADDYRLALTVLNENVINTPGRPSGFDIVPLTEANRIAATAAKLPGLSKVESPIAAALSNNLACDVRIVLHWDTDNADVDLAITDPSGEVCTQGHNFTTIGGLMSQNVRDGFGPEQFVLRKAMPGTYKVRAWYAEAKNPELTGPCTVYATVITNFGRPDEKRQVLTGRLSRVGQHELLGTFDF